ncbi:MAG TPA: phage tail terminator-like protein [Reyranella sp.]|nr:phage tail terminator-like protein [Reyranella sp.]
MTISSQDIRLSLRGQLLTLVVATTGAISLSVTASGYVRTSGSFVTDGFVAGMELLASGFGTGTNNGPQVITAVTPLTLSVSGLSAEGAGAGRSLTVGVPSTRLYENLVGRPIQLKPYLQEQYAPAPPVLGSGPAAGAMVDSQGLYVATLFGVPNTGDAAADRMADAVMALFKPGTTLPLTSGYAVRVLQQMPWRSQIRNDDRGAPFVVVTVPWRVFSNNS